MRYFPVMLCMLGCACLVRCHQNSGPATSPGKGSTDTLFTVSDSVARHYVQNYGAYSRRDSSAHKLSGKEHANTRCIWFSLTRLQNLVDSISQEGGDGVRFYLAAYDSTYKNTGMHTPDTSHWGHITLVMVSTFQRDTTIGNNYKVFHQDYYNDKTGLSHRRGIVILTDPENRGELCPPPADCGAEGATLLQP